MPALERPARAPVDDARAAAILRQVRLQLSPRTREATLELSPRSLGRIEVKVRIEDGRMHATLRVERAETLAALERYVPELRAALGAHDIETESFELSLGFEDDTAGSSASGERSPASNRGRTANIEPERTPHSANEPLRSELAAALVDGSRIDTYV